MAALKNDKGLLFEPVRDLAEGASLRTAVTVLVRRSSDASVLCDGSPPTERAPDPR